MNDSLKTHSDVTVGSKWRNKRSGIVAEVTRVTRDYVYLKRERHHASVKWIDHFLREYEVVS